MSAGPEQAPKALQNHSRPLGGVPSKNLQRGLGCPVCAAKMQTVNYLGEAAVHIERCLACQAVWRWAMLCETEVVEEDEDKESGEAE